MTDLFASLVDRALDRMPLLQRRQPALFEPVGQTAFGEQSKSGNVAPLEENEIAVESRPSSVKQKHFVTNALLVSQPSSRLEEPDPETIEGPRTRRLVHESRQPQTDQDNDIQSVSFASSEKQARVTGPAASRSPESAPGAVAKLQEATIAAPREIETIVEKSVEPDIFTEHSTNKPAIREVHASGQPDSQLKPARYDDGVQPMQALQAEVKRETPQTIIKPAIQTTPAPRPDAPRVKQATSRAKSNEHAQKTAPPVINVTIGRVEVRATSQTQTKAQPVRSGGPKMSLEDYLRSRGKEN